MQCEQVPPVSGLRYPAKSASDGADLFSADRCTTLASLYPPPAALGLVTVNSRHAAVNTEQIQPFEKRKKRKHAFAYFLFLAPTVGLEPTTLRLTAACSTD